jgi:DNA-binding MarR family transcriptional regulator
MARSPRQAAAAATPPKWLTPAQLEAWQALTLMLARLPTALEAQLQRDSQLSFVEYYALAGLSEQPDRTMRMSELAVLTNAELSRLSHLITRLQKRGYVRREPDPDDGRYTNAILTDTGYDLVVAAAPGHVAAVRELVIDALDDSALKALQNSAERINARIDDPRHNISSDTTATTDRRLHHRQRAAPRRRHDEHPAPLR